MCSSDLNALRYTDSGGHVDVTLEVRGEHAVVEIGDSGIGIAPEYLERIFDRFWRSPAAKERVSDGSGVGLALVSELVRAHDGRVAVESEPGHGTTFSVSLPLSERSAAPARRPAAAVPDLWRRRGELGASGAPAENRVAG